MSVLPESSSASSEDSDVDRPKPGGETTGRDSNAVEGRHQRALSSSSAESGTYIADQPSAIFHASSSIPTSRLIDRERCSLLSADNSRIFCSSKT